MRRQFALALTALLCLVLPAPAGAYVIQDFSTASATNGIALGADGNFWVAETNQDTVVRMTPAGQIAGRFTVGNGPTSIAAGPGGTVWVSVTGARVLARIDTATGAVATFPMLPGCGPVAIADGGNGRMYFSQPGDCGGGSFVGSITVNGTDLQRTGSGRIYDIAIAGGKLFAADFETDAVRRFSLAPAPVQETGVMVNGSPDGIAIDGSGTVWVTQYSAGGVARFPAAQNGGSAVSVPVAGGTFGQPFGIVAAPDGRIYVTGQTSRNIGRLSADGTWKFFQTDGQPWDIVAGPDGDLYFTDIEIGRVRRLVSSAPRITGGTGTPTATTSANVAASIDARGNATTVTFEYGPTAAYGAAVTVPVSSSVGPFPVGATLTGLTPGTTYHFRVRAINEEGEAPPGGDLTFTTPAPVITLKARANFSWGFKGSRTALTRIRVTDLSGGETIKITCSGKRKGCPIKSRTYRNVKQGTRSLTSLFGRKRLLRTGAKIVVTITKPGAIGSTATLTIGKRKKDPKIVRRTLTS